MNRPIPPAPARLDPHEVREWTEALGLAWTDAEAKYEVLDATEDVLLARLIESQSEGKSFAQKKNDATASPEYKLHRIARAEAKAAMHAARVRYDTAMRSVDVAISVNANRRRGLTQAGALGD